MSHWDKGDKALYKPAARPVRNIERGTEVEIVEKPRIGSDKVRVAVTMNGQKIKKYIALENLVPVNNK